MKCNYLNFDYNNIFDYNIIDYNNINIAFNKMYRKTCENKNGKTCENKKIDKKINKNKYLNEWKDYIFNTLLYLEENINVKNNIIDIIYTPLHRLFYDNDVILTKLIIYFNIKNSNKTKIMPLFLYNYEHILYSTHPSKTIHCNYRNCTIPIIFTYDQKNDIIYINLILRIYFIQHEINYNENDIKKVC